MILKRNFDPRKVTTYVWRQLVVALLWSAAVYVAYVVFGLSFVSAPFGILGIFGTALAIFLALRNNTAFGRWGEASQAWAAITAAAPSPDSSSPSPTRTGTRRSIGPKRRKRSGAR